MVVGYSVHKPLFGECILHRPYHQLFGWATEEKWAELRRWAERQTCRGTGARSIVHRVEVGGQVAERPRLLECLSKYPCYVCTALTPLAVINVRSATGGQETRQPSSIHVPEQNPRHVRLRPVLGGRAHVTLQRAAIFVQERFWDRFRRM